MLNNMLVLAKHITGASAFSLILTLLNYFLYLHDNFHNFENIVYFEFYSQFTALAVAHFRCSAAISYLWFVSTSFKNLRLENVSLLVSVTKHGCRSFMFSSRIQRWAEHRAITSLTKAYLLIDTVRSISDRSRRVKIPGAAWYRKTGAAPNVHAAGTRARTRRIIVAVRSPHRGNRVDPRADMRVVVEDRRADPDNRTPRDRPARICRGSLR